MMRTLLALVLVSQTAFAGEMPKVSTNGRVVVTDTTCEILDPLEYAMNDAAMLPKQHRIIRAVAATLKANPEIKLIEIEGFADPTERVPSVIALARAQGVVSALIKEGVEPIRLRASSQGTRGAVRNKTTRRVEFLIVTRS